MRFPAVLIAVVAAAAAVAVSGEGQPPAQAGALPPIEEQVIELAVPGTTGTEYVTVTLFAAAEPGADMASRRAAGRAAMLARFPGAVEMGTGEVAAQFKLFPTPVRWPQPSASWLYNPSGSTPAMPAKLALEAIALGSEGWDNAGGSGFHFDYLGETAVATGCNGVPTALPRDGANIVGWGHIAGGYLGYSCHWRSASLVEGTPYFALTEFDIVFEPSYAYSASTLRALALHEFGHSLGLDHTEPTLCPGQAMCGGMDALRFTSPRPDDVFGVVALYGVAPPSPVVPAGPRPYRAVGPGISRD